jgi:hypothetical protein
MSFKPCISKEMHLSRKILLLLLVSLCCNIVSVFSTGCEKVATLPKDFQHILPQYEKLKRLHVSNFFFLDDSPGKDVGSTLGGNQEPSNYLKINLSEKSVFKVQITPHHVGIEVNLKINNQDVLLETSPGVPLDYTSYQAINPGQVELWFSVSRDEDNQVESELSSKTSHDSSCNLPYMKLEVYIEEHSHLMDRLKHIRRETDKLEELSMNLSEMFGRVRLEFDTHGESAQEKVIISKDEKHKKLKTDLEAYKLTLPKGSGLQFYNQYNVSVISEYDLSVPDDQIQEASPNSTNSHSPHIINKFILKMQFYSDFYLGGSYFFMLLRESDIESLANYDCLYDGKCFISEKPSKNSMLLEAILTPGNYKILLINLNMNFHLDKTSVDMRKHLGIDSIPITAKIKVNYFQKAENRFNCEGRHLPQSFDYLMMSNTQSDSYFEYKGDIIMNMNKLHDDVEFSVDEDAVLRLITFYPHGNNIDISLYEVTENKVLDKLIQHKGNLAMQNLISKILQTVLPHKNHKEEKIQTMSKNAGESDGLVYPLKKGLRYRLVFNYDNSFFEERDRKFCEMFYLKLAIGKNSYLNKLNSGSCSNTPNFSDIDTLVRNLESNHRKNDVYSYTTPQTLKVEYHAGEMNSIIYSKMIDIKNPIDLHIEVISEFITSYIVPIIIPIKNSQISSKTVLNEMLHHKYKKLIFHENTLKLKLNKGKYMLVLMSGLSQLNFNNSANLTPLNINSLLKCMSFKLRVSSLRLTSKKMLNWECNYKHYDEIPSDFGEYLQDKEKYTYFNNNLLLPGFDKQVPFKAMKLKTGSKGYFLRLVAEYSDKNESHKKRYFEVNLYKNGKVIKKAKDYIIDHGLTSDQMFLNYYLKPNTEYEILFEITQPEHGWKYFEYCRTFKLEINMVREDILQNQSRNSGRSNNRDTNSFSSSCVENIPKTEDVIYERLIDLNNSFYKYGTQNAFSMFKSSMEKSTEKKDTNIKDLEVAHPKSSQFTFRFNPEAPTTGKDLKNSFSYDFEVKALFAKATILIENQSLVGISAKLGSFSNESSELIAAEDMEGQGLFSIRNLMLTSGKYKITFYVNTHSDKKYNSLLKDQCVSFAATVLLENRPFDYAKRNVGENYETCPYMYFPHDLNIPGWIHADTDYTLNEYMTFRLKDEMKTQRFSIKEKSIFKFHIPTDDGNNLFSYMSLYKLKSNSNNKQKLIEKLEKDSNYMTTVLEKGTYMLEFTFSGVGDTSNPGFSKDCNFFDVYMAIIPASNVKGGIEAFNNHNCQEQGLPKNNEILPNTYLEFAQLRFSNVADKTLNTNEEQVHPEMQNVSQNKIFKLLPSNTNGKFVAELVSNHYTDVMYKFMVFEIMQKKNTKVHVEVPVELIKHENYMWVSFHFDKHKEYALEILSANFDAHSVCSDVVFSYNYEEYENTVEKKNDTEEEYLTKKDTCHVDDHLPMNFFDNSSHHLDRYGGPQSETNGEINFLGEFLLPKSSTILRSEFVIRTKSVVFVKLIPKYAHVQVSNVQIQIYQDKRMIFSFHHNEHNGILLAELDITSVYNAETKQYENSKATPYFLQLVFDRVLTECETFELIFSVIPKDVYTGEYLACDQEREKLPDSLSFDKTSQYSLSSLLQPKRDPEFKIEENDLSVIVKNIKIVLPKATTITAELEYITSDNFMDIELLHDRISSQEGYTDEVLELGKESTHPAPQLKGITTKKEINVNLKKGHYILRVVYHRFFSDLLKKHFEREYQDNAFCLAFDLRIEGVILKNLKRDSQDEKDDDETNPELDHLQKKDFTSNFQNIITSIDPASLKQIKLESGFDLEIKFAYPLELPNSAENETKHLHMIYLQDIHNQSGRKIYPHELLEIDNKSIKFNFQVNSDNFFEMTKCYKLHIDDSFKNVYDSEAIETLNHLYCLEHCECYSLANYKCSKNGKCICYAPYTGAKCSDCITGYVKNKEGKCVDQQLENAKCEEKITCSGHGKCTVNTFDAYSVTSNNKNGPCKCNDNFSSYNSPPGFPAQNFCNTCTNPSKVFPMCGEKLGEESDDALSFNLESNCNESQEAISLPSRLYDNVDPEEESELEDPVLSSIGGGQDSDGSLDLLAVFLVKKPEETSKIFIPEDSLIRVFYESHEMNRAKVMVLKNKYDQEAIAYTEGKEKTESFIAKLDAKNSPYYLKVMHNKMKYGCNRYRLKIVIEPMRLAVSDLKCKSSINIQDKDNLLPPQNIVLDSSTVHGMDKVYILPDYLLLNVDNTSTQHTPIDFSQTGVLTKARYDEEFVYNIKLDVKNPISFSANVLFDFLTSDFSLVLRESNGKIIKSGDWLIPDVTVHVSDHDFINGLQTILDPGQYHLTLVQNVPANHIMQLIHEVEREKKKSHVPRCFKFNLHIQTSIINKPDASISTTKFESMYNRIVSVEPESMASLNVNQKFEIFVTFEDSISTSTKSQKFKDVFYLENTRTHEKVPAGHVYLQGALAKTFAIIYDEKKLNKDECYELKYNLDILESANDKDRKIVSDSPIVHKFCTKSCNCNPHTNFECDSNSRCICEEPYTGEGCYSCIEGWFSARGKCISESNCRMNFCSGHGHCINDNSYSQSSVKLPTCRCDPGFTGKDCSKCENSNDVFPDCVKVEQVSKNVENFDNFLKTEQEEVNELDIERNRCAHAFVPHNLDSLGYLHLDGNMHISGKYSLKHINNKHYSMIFTIKERSHVKLFMEHSKYTHMINMFLIDDNRKHLLNGSVHVGPAGMGSASSIDFIVDPIKKPDNTFAHYEIALFIKDIPTEDGNMMMSYAEDVEISNLTEECFTVFLEMQVMTASKESTMITNINNEPQCQQKKEKLPTLIPSNVNLLDYHTVFYNSIEQTMTKYTHIRNSINQSGINYFHYEYFYVPDHLDRELILELEVYSKFINSDVGVLLEIVEIPTTIKIDHKKLNARKLQDIVEKSLNGKKLDAPECTIHCFTAIKKFNSVLLSRVLPSDTFFRIWFYDMSPLTKNLVSGRDETPTSCVNFEVLLNLKNAKTDDKALRTKREAALCTVPSLPKSLNTKGFLGDSRYLEKWGFHLLDNFRIDDSIETGLVHETTFEIKEYHMLRMVVFHGRVDTDLELFYHSSNGEEILIARSNSKNFEDALVMQIPPGHYKIVFKFFPPSTGFHKCESIRMEFSMDKFTNLQTNIDRMVARHQNNPKLDKINMFEIFSSSSSNVNIFEKDSVSHRYSVKLPEPFNINKDDAKNYESSISISEITFVIEPEDSGKVEIISYVNSDFLYLDANIYLSYLPSNQDKTKSKIIAGIHKKNMNMLSTGPLESGTYIMSLRYYRRLHYSGTDSKDVQLFRATFGEVEFDSMLVNRSDSDVSILTSDGYIKLPPYNDNKTSVTHNWLCRHAGLPLPKSLSNLRYLEFNPDSHILDTFLVPPMGVGEEVIKFRLKFSVNTMIRVYVECHHTDIDLELREVTSHSEYKVIAASKENIHFETIMQIISDEKEYEIVLKFNGKGENSNQTHMSISDHSQSCQTFKMEIALEKSHNYACPNNGKYALLTDLKPIPEVLPVKSKDNKNQSKIYKYDSRNTYLGDEKGSGYVYLLRSQSDKVIEYTTFNVESDVDFKIEIENDFMQAPVNIFLTSSNPEHKHLQNHNMNLAHNALQLQDAFIVSFGEIFENRTVMLIKDLPKGSYTIYLYLPGLKTRFINEPRVCSIYDILVEIKKSRTHFKLKEIIDTSEIRETNLDIPTTLPVTLSSLKYLENDEKYINFFTEVFLRKNNTITEGQNYDLYNTITFSVTEESLVEFYVSHDQLKEKLQVAIEGFSHFADYSSTILKPGKYKAVVKVENPKNSVHVDGKPEAEEIFHISSLDHVIQFYVGISPVNRVTEIYNYNNIQSSYHQCRTMPLPTKLDQEKETGIYNYHTDFFTFNKADLRNLKLGQFTQHLTSNNNRILIEIGADNVLNKLSMVVKSENKSWKTMWYNNVGDLDIIVPKGTYTFELELEERIFLTNLECIIFSLDIHIIDMDSKVITSGHEHPLYHSHMFDSAHTKSRLLKPTCEGTVLPIELHRNADEEYNKIKENGDYLLHINKASYFNSKQHSKDGENPNEVDINLHMISLVHVTTTVEKPNEFQVIPKMKFYNKNLSNDENNYWIPTDMEFISHSLKERNTLWFLDANKSPSDEYYTLELLQEKYEDLHEASHSYHCPNYGLDILIQSLAEIVNKLQCIQKSDDELMQYILPNKTIPVFKATSNSPYVKNNNNYSYHEKIKFTYFTEQQYGDNYLESETFIGLQYVINFEIEDNEYHLSLELGFDQVVSLFDVFLSKHEDNDTFSTRVIEVSDPYFDKADQHFPYKRILSTKLTKGKYVIVLAEELWNDINVNVRSRAGLDASKKLCLPFSYSIDIVPANHVSAPAEILSIFPPGPLAFKSAEEDLQVTIVLSKPAFTRKHEAITYTENFMNVINAFYLIKSPTKGKSDGNFNEPSSQNKIHPSKLEGSEDNMHWTLLFLGENFESNYDYELHLDSSWLQDVTYAEFKLPTNKKMPIFRVETQKEQIVEFVDSIQKMKNEMNEADMTVQKEEALKSGQTPPPAKNQQISPAQSKSKCGEHGKLIYDNILKKQVCTCLDGFSGKFCQVCEGVYDKKSNKCIIKEEDTDEDDLKPSEPISESISQHINQRPADSASKTTQYVPQKPQEYKSCAGGCVNGYCDSKTGRCVCDIEYTGPRCDRKKTVTEKAKVQNLPNIESQGYMHLLLNLM